MTEFHHSSCAGGSPPLLDDVLDTRPTLSDLWKRYHFKASVLSQNSGICGSTVVAMLRDRPVNRRDAEKVLSHLSSLLPQGEYTFQTVKVKLVEEGEQNRSEVARLLNQIGQEYIAAQRGMRGLAQGTARHSFITTRMENMGKLEVKLRAFVGEEEAIGLVAARLDEVQESNIGIERVSSETDPSRN